jgi:hypothetical protein
MVDIEVRARRSDYRAVDASALARDLEHFESTALHRQPRHW